MTRHDNDKLLRLCCYKYLYSRREVLSNRPLEVMQSLIRLSEVINSAMCKKQIQFTGNTK